MTPPRKRKQPLGKQLMKLRKEQKFSLKYLANHTGLATKYISQIEKGEIIPPVSAILRLSRALGIGSNILLKEEKSHEGKPSIRYNRKQTKGYSYKILTLEDRDEKLKAFKVFVDPRSDFSEMSYQHLGEELIYVLKGKVEVKVGHNKNTLGPGECLHFNSSIVHKLKSTSDEKAELIVVLYVP